MKHMLEEAETNLLFQSCLREYGNIFDLDDGGKLLKEFKIYICERIIKSVFFFLKDKNDGKSYVW